MGSNGLTSARHDVFGKALMSKYPESFDPTVPEDLIYSGQCGLIDASGTDLDIGKLVLSPTRTYAPVVIALLKELKGEIDGMIHCSGGAHTKVMHFMDKHHVIKDNIISTFGVLNLIKDNMIEIPPLFKLIQEQSGTSWEEMYKVFNMGCRLELYVDEKHAQTILDIAKSFNIHGQVIGRVEAQETNQVSIHTDNGTFSYK